MSDESMCFAENATIQLTKSDLATLLVDCLVRMRTPGDMASKVAESLIENEFLGYSSHGILRIQDILTAIAEGHLDPAATPLITFHSSHSFTINGNNAFGITIVEELVKKVNKVLQASPICIATVVKGAHLGRLSDIARGICEQDNIILGFVNFSGAGKKVALPGGNEAVLCTNPIVMGFPGRKGPVIVDFATSTVSEGKIRDYMIRGKKIPKDWLIAKDGSTTSDPSGLYRIPPTTFITSLGGRKGFLLGLCVEIIAGILAGGGAVYDKVQASGNSGLFIGLRLNAFEHDQRNIKDEIEALLEYLDTCKSTGTSERFRVPGRHSSQHPNTVKIPKALLDYIESMAKT